METPILTKNQQKKALSSKKAKRETIKNVLATPYSYYWPLVNEEDFTEVNTHISKALPLLQSEPIKIPWAEIKDLAREKRKEFRAEYKKSKNQKPIDTSLRKHLNFGINETAQSLESNQVCFILITNDVNPQFMVQHILDMAIMKFVPVLIVPGLRQLLKSCTGISSICFSLKKEHNSNELLELEQAIIKISNHYPIPKNHFSNFKKDLNQDNLLTEEFDISGINKVEEMSFQEADMENKSAVNNSKLSLENEGSKSDTQKLNSEDTLNSTKQVYQLPVKEAVPAPNSNTSNFMDFLSFDTIPGQDTKTHNDSKNSSGKSFYLSRVNTIVRVFVPECRKVESEVYSSSKTKSIQTAPNNKLSSPYIPLKVNKIRNNKDRNKRKAENMKKENKNARYY